jgi:hypothetical protein
MRRMFYLYALVSVVVVSLWLALLLVDAHFGIDFYPLYFAGDRIRAGFSPYGADATAQLVREWPARFAAAGVAYPLPLLLLIVPFTLLPFALAAGVWVSLGGMSSFAALRLSPAWRTLILLPFLFLPFHRSVVLGQATLIWFGLAAILVSAIYARQPWAVGLASALLLLKPQNGLFFALAGLVWGLVAHRRALWWFFGVSFSLGVLAFLLQPGWLSAWIAQLELYQATVHPPSLLPGGLLLLVACWRLPWWARVAAAQVVFFPLSDLYSALPLLFCWIGIGGPLALLGAGLSWLWSIAGLSNTINMFWWLLIWPLMLSAVWRTWLQPRLRPTPNSAIAANTATPANPPAQPAPLSGEPDRRHFEG